MGAIILGAPIPPSELIPPDRPQPPDLGRANLGGLLNATHVSLAREIAQGMVPFDDLPALYGYTGVGDPRWQAIMDHPEFQRLLAEAVREWNSADGTAKRISFKARAAVEANIEVIHAGINSPDIPYVQKVEGMKLLSRLGGVGEAGGAQKGGGGSGFSVTINIAGGQQVRLAAQQESNVIEHEDSDTGSESAGRPAGKLNAVLGGRQ